MCNNPYLTAVWGWQGTLKASLCELKRSLHGSYVLTSESCSWQLRDGAAAAAAQWHMIINKLCMY